MKAIPITRARFDALCVIRAPSAQFLAAEVEWWSINNDCLIGTVLFDPSDDTWSFMILGRDSDKLFRGIDQGHNFDSQAAASAAIQERLAKHAGEGQTLFPQGDVKRPGNTTGLVTPIVAVEKMHRHFQTLIESREYSAAKDLLSEFSPVFVDVDGNFIEQFQSSGFNQRLWEIYLDLMLREQGFERVSEFDRPDFCVIKHGVRVGMEAVTVNPSDKHPIPEVRTNEGAVRLMQEFMPMRFSGPLTAKLGKRYWELPHMSGVPIVIAIQNFFTDQAMTWSLNSLIRYLYGIHSEGFVGDDGVVDVRWTPVTEHVWGEKKVESGFFRLPGAENISAVIANPCATLSMFNRKGKEAGLGDKKIRMIRKGNQWDPNPRASSPLRFEYEVTSQHPRERWSDGLALFLNPNAKNPLPDGLFDVGELHVLDDGKLIPYLKEGHVYASQTFIFKPE